jgi:hypothetical protein
MVNNWIRMAIDVSGLVSGKCSFFNNEKTGLGDEK